MFISVYRYINSTVAHESLAVSDSTESQVGLNDDKVASRNASAAHRLAEAAASFLAMCKAIHVMRIAIEMHDFDGR